VRLLASGIIFDSGGVKSPLLVVFYKTIYAVLAGFRYIFYLCCRLFHGRTRFIMLTNFLDRFSSGTAILITISIILLSGFLVTRLTKLLKLPNVSGYIIAGILIGPHLFNLVPQNIVDNMSFVSDIALAFIAFGIGRFFKKETLRETGASVIVITLLEALLAGVLVTMVMYFCFRLDLMLSLLLGAIATATAPASTLMTINQYHARGKFVSVLLQVVALDDVVCLLVFSVVAAIVNAVETGNVSAASVLLPIAYNIGAMILGFVFAFVLARLLSPKRSTDNRLILAIAMLVGLSGLCSIFDISPLLSCMIFGAVYMNMTRDDELYRQINNFTPPVMSIFFVLSGMNLDIGALSAFGIVGIVYFLVRIVGKYFGAYLGCLMVKSEKSIRNYLGVALIPQAGVAIGLAYLAKRILPDEIGNLLMTIILASSVLYELIGPACAKFALIRSGAIKKEALKDGKTPKSSNPPAAPALEPASGASEASVNPELSAEQTPSENQTPVP